MAACHSEKIAQNAPARQHGMRTQGNMRVLVTGVTGFTANAPVRQMPDPRHEAFALDDGGRCRAVEALCERLSMAPPLNSRCVDRYRRDGLPPG
jgi:hypothetical protein